MFSSVSLVKSIVFEKQKTGKTNKNITNTEDVSTVPAICGAILELDYIYIYIHIIYIYIYIYIS